MTAKCVPFLAMISLYNSYQFREPHYCMIAIFIHRLLHHLQDGNNPMDLAKLHGCQSVVDYLVTLEGEYIYTSNHDNKNLLLLGVHMLLAKQVLIGPLHLVIPRSIWFKAHDLGIKVAGYRFNEIHDFARGYFFLSQVYLCRRSCSVRFVCL